jgi:hypothetical protein
MIFGEGGLAHQYAPGPCVGPCRFVEDSRGTGAPQEWRDYAGEEQKAAMQEEAHVTAAGTRSDGARHTWRVTHVKGSVITPEMEEEERRQRAGLDKPPPVPEPVVHIDDRIRAHAEITTTSSADESTKRYWRAYTPARRGATGSDSSPGGAACPPSSLCAMARSLNAEHMGGLSPRGSEIAHVHGPWAPAGQLQLGPGLAKESGGHGDNWAGPGGEAAEAARRNTAAAAGRAPSLCDICMAHALTDAGPARFLVGRAVTARARKRRCAALCSNDDRL